MLGLCFPQAWMYVVGQGPISNVEGFQLAFHLGLLTVLILLALAPNRNSLASKTVLDISSSLLMAAVPLMGLLPITPASTTCAVAALLGGIGIGWSFARWFLIYSLYDIKGAFLCVLLAFSGGSALSLVMGALDPIAPSAASVVALCLPFLSCAASRASFKNLSSNADNDPPEKNSALHSHTASIMAQLLIYAVVFGNGIVFSALQGAISTSPESQAITFLKYSLRTALPLLLYAWVRSLDASRGTYRPLFNAIILAGACLLLTLAWFLGFSYEALSYALISLARNIVLMLIYLALLRLSVASTRPALLLFSVGRGTYELAIAIGMAAYSQLENMISLTATPPGLVFVIALGVFIFLASCLLATVQNLAVVPDRVSLTSIPRDDNNLTSEITVLREKWGLSEREAQITMFFATGNSKKRIAKNLGLSENTIRWYLSQIYTKLDVHSRDELIELVNEKSG